MNENNQIKGLLTNRQTLIEVVLIAAVIGIGINFISTSIYDHFKFNHKNLVFFIIGAFLFLVSAIYFTYRIFQRKKVERLFKGFITIGKDERMPIACEGYEYSEELRRNFNAAFSENKALKHIWESEKTERRDRDKIIIEATEYYVIDTLSTHLTDYFNSKNIDKSQIEELSRKHIPHVLLENRFLELFSKPMEQREQFIRDVEKDKQSKPVGKIVMSMGKSGALFKDFDLVLPKKSKVYKSDNTFIIETPRFKLGFKVNYMGFGAVIPFGYVKHFLGYESYEEQSSHHISLKVTIDYKWTSYFSNNGWDYYEWLDLFLFKIEKEFSESNYFDTLNWESVYAQTKILESMLKKK